MSSMSARSQLTIVGIVAQILLFQCAVDFCAADHGIDHFLNVKYKFDTSSENFDKCLEALGVNADTRKNSEMTKPVAELTKSGDHYSLWWTNSAFKDTETKFKLGEEFDEMTPDGRKVKSTITQDGNKLIHTQKGDKIAKIITEFMPTELKKTLTVGDITCTRMYKAQ